MQSPVPFRRHGDGRRSGGSGGARASSGILTGMTERFGALPLVAWLTGVIRRWQAFTQTPLGVRLLPVYVSLLGAGVGVLVADRLVRSMWRHAIFTGPHQWRTVALLLTLFWIAIGAVAALALLGPPDEAAGEVTTEAQGLGDV